MLKVLIAEDNVILADMLEDFLVAEGYDVCGLARTVDEAVKLADLKNPDLAVLDYRLAHGEYGSQIRPLLKDKITMGILYASGDPLNNKLSKIDGDAYIQKPYGLNDIVHALRIIHEIKLHHHVPPFSFPRGFCLLEDAKDNYLQLA